MNLKINQKKYHDKVIIENFKFEFCQGMTLIKGKSGSGKTTLLNILAAIDNNYDGEIIINNKQASILSYADLIKGNKSFIFQDYKLIKDINVKENITYFTDMFDIKYTKAEYTKIIKLLKIDKFINNDIENLSGGEQQRVAIARALLTKPKILFADEPTGNLDKQNKMIIFNLLKEISLTIPVVAISHDADILSFADNIISYKDGKIYSKYTLESATELKFIDRHLSSKFIKKFNKKDFKYSLLTYVLVLIALFFAASFIDSAYSKMQMQKNEYEQLLNTEYQFVVTPIENTNPPKDIKDSLANYPFENGHYVVEVPILYAADYCNPTLTKYYSCYSEQYNEFAFKEKQYNISQIILGASILVAIMLFLVSWFMIYYNIKSKADELILFSFLNLTKKEKRKLLIYKQMWLFILLASVIIFIGTWWLLMIVVMIQFTFLMWIAYRIKIKFTNKFWLSQHKLK